LKSLYYTTHLVIYVKNDVYMYKKYIVVLKLILTRAVTLN